MAPLALRSALAYAIVVTTSSAMSARSGAQVSAAHAVDDGIYAYTDDRGSVVYANRLQDVPVQLRQYARRVDQPTAKAPDVPSAALFDWVTPAREHAKASPELYQYRGRGGRITYTNLAESVPMAQRASAKIDLEKVPVNSQLGVEIDRQLKTQYDKLRESGFCRAIQAAVNESFWQRAWRNHAPLVVCGGAILAFLLATPLMVRKFGGVQWARALSMAIPALAFTGLVSFLIVKSGNSMSELRDRAQPCDPSAWGGSENATKAEAPDAAPESPLVKHLRMVSALKNETQLLDQINAESR